MKPWINNTLVVLIPRLCMYIIDVVIPCIHVVVELCVSVLSGVGLIRCAYSCNLLCVNSVDKVKSQ